MFVYIITGRPKKKIASRVIIWRNVDVENKLNDNDV